MTTKAARSRGMPRHRLIQTQAPPSQLPLMVGGAVVIVLLAAAAASMLMTSTASTTLAEPAVRPVAVSGVALPAFTDPASDSAVFQPLPRLAGIGLDGAPMTITGGDGPMAIVVLAHWCSYCQAEVPEITGFLQAGRLPEGVEVVALATSIDPARPNFPPSSWLEREAWTIPTLIDDASNGGLAALGLGSFPGFVFVDADGRVAHRHTGALGADAFGQLVEGIAP